MFLTNPGSKITITADDGTEVVIQHGRRYYAGDEHNAIMTSNVLWAAHAAGRIDIEAKRPEQASPLAPAKKKTKKSAKPKKTKKTIKVG